MRANVYEAIALERAAQDSEFGGPAHDDNLEWADWGEFLEKQLRKADRALDLRDRDEYRRRLIMAAALCVAAVESHDRNRSSRDRA